MVASMAAAAMVACDRPPAASNATVGESPLESARNSAPVAPRSGGSADLKQRQMDFLNRIREADPQFKTIDRALLNEQNELGLILDRGVDLESIPQLMKGMLAQMAKEFPGEDLTVIAYTPSNPPLKIGTGRLNARTRDMTYTPEQR